MRRWLRRVLLLVVIVAVMVVGWRFASENQEPVGVHYVAGEAAAVPLWQVILAAFGAGAGLVWLAVLYTSARHGLAQRRYRKAIADLEAEIHQLRNLPLATADASARQPSPILEPPTVRSTTLAPESDFPGSPPPVGALPTGGASGRNG